MIILIQSAGRPAADQDNKRKRILNFYGQNPKICKKMAGVAGVEPTSTVLETVVLPLNYTPKVQFVDCLRIITEYIPWINY